MAGVLVAVSIVLFAAGFLLGALIVVAVGIRAEDKAAMARKDGSIVLREEPRGSLTRGVRWLTGVGYRTGASQRTDESHRGEQ